MEPAPHANQLQSFRDQTAAAPAYQVARLRTGSTVDRRIQLVLLLIQENFHQQIAITEIAGIVNLSPGRLAHLFKNETGMGVQQYITQIRLDKAGHLLEASFLSIKEVAANVGFTNFKSFATSFKALVGVTPAQYRKLAASQPNRKNLAIAKSANK